MLSGNALAWKKKVEVLNSKVLCLQKLQRSQILVTRMVLKAYLVFELPSVWSLGQNLAAANSGTLLKGMPVYLEAPQVGW